MSKYETAAEFGAGAGIGMLIGLITGLSASPVVSTVLGSLAAGLLGLLGIGGGQTKDEENTVRPRRALRVFGFGLFSAIFLVIGILLRTHSTLAPPLAAQERELSSSGLLSKSEQHQILLLKAFGLTQSVGEKEAASLSPATNKSVAGISASVLFASRTDVCQVMRRDQYNNLSSYLESLRNHRGEYAALADAISHASIQDQEAIASSLDNLLCK